MMNHLTLFLSSAQIMQHADPSDVRSYKKLLPASILENMLVGNFTDLWELCIIGHHALFGWRRTVLWALLFMFVLLHPPRRQSGGDAENEKRRRGESVFWDLTKKG